MNIDWSKAPEGYPIWIEDLEPDAWKDMGGWHKEEDDKYVDEDGRFWSKPEDRFYRVYRNPNESWTGTGLPPVGTVCEWRDDDFGDWRKVEVKYMSKHTALLAFDVADDCEGAFSPANCQFRPIRTQAQIEAEERRTNVYAIERVMLRGQEQALTITEIAAALHDAGYRKQPKEGA